jgi:hypothetical protein
MMRAARASGREARPCPDFGRRGWAALLTFLTSLAAGTAAAQPPDNADPTLAPWFRSLQAPNGVSCCSIADCRTTDYRTNGDGYEAFVDNRWIAVPRDRVLDHVDNIVS